MAENVQDSTIELNKNETIQKEDFNTSNNENEVNLIQSENKPHEVENLQNICKKTLDSYINITPVDIEPNKNECTPSETSENVASGSSSPEDEEKIEETNNMSQDEWSKREKTLLEKISSLEQQQDNNSMNGLQLQLKVKCEENEMLRAKLINTQTELCAVLKKPNSKNKDIVSKIKKQHEELLTKAKGMIFDKTKIIKNQELQIEALTAQVSSLKEVATITKNLLEIRNLEVGHLQDRLEVMDMKIQAERDRHNLMVKKIDSGTKLNENLKKEYETQLVLFKELKQRYEEKFLKLQEENESKQNGPSTSSTN